MISAVGVVIRAPRCGERREDSGTCPAAREARCTAHCVEEALQLSCRAARAPAARRNEERTLVCGFFSAPGCGPGCCWPSRCRLPGCLFIASPWLLTAETRQPARQDCLTRPARQWLRYPGLAQRQALTRRRTASGRIAPLSTRPGAPRARRACVGLEDDLSRRSIGALQSADKPWPALAVAWSLAGIAVCGPAREGAIDAAAGRDSCRREDRCGQPRLAGDRCLDRGKDIEVLVHAGG